MSNSVDPDETAHCAISSGSMLFAKAYLLWPVALKELKHQAKFVADDIPIFFFFFCNFSGKISQYFMR